MLYCSLYRRISQSQIRCSERADTSVHVISIEHTTRNNPKQLEVPARRSHDSATLVAYCKCSISYQCAYLCKIIPKPPDSVPPSLEQRTELHHSVGPKSVQGRTSGLSTRSIFDDHVYLTCPTFKTIYIPSWCGKPLADGRSFATMPP